MFLFQTPRRHTNNRYRKNNPAVHPARTESCLLVTVLFACLLQPLPVVAEPGQGAGDDQEILIIDETDSGEMQDMEIDHNPEIIQTEDLPLDSDEDTILFMDTEDPAVETGLQDSSSWTDYTRYQNGRFSIGLDKARLEYGNLYQSKSSVNTSNYGHLAFSSQWKQNKNWEIRLGGRIDWYDQTGNPQLTRSIWIMATALYVIGVKTTVSLPAHKRSSGDALTKCHRQTD